jgi:thiamine biosynthesis lipoprotein
LLNFHAIFSRVLVILGLILVLGACSQSKQEIHLSGPTMGTLYNVKYVDTAGVDAQALAAGIEQELAKINQLMSTYIQVSELSRFNNWASTEPFPVSGETIAVIQEAQRLGELSNGLLDVTVGPLVNIWGFGPSNKPKSIPSPADIANAKKVVGYDKLIIEGNTLTKTEPSLYVDLSTIAKGYAVDRLAAILEEFGLNNYLVEIGGEMRLAGLKQSQEPWKIAIEKPEMTTRSTQKIISVGNNAIATSGDYRNYYEEDGVRYSHLIDPKTGYPISHNLVSVTVIHPSSMTADGLATALNVMGTEKALALAEQEGLAVFLIARENGVFKEYSSSAFQKNITVY